MILERDEYIEQAYLFRTLRERMQQNMSTQELLVAVRQEILSTTKLPMAVDFMASELKLTGGFASAMAQLSHYFAPFQTYLVREAEKEEGRFDFRIALEILQREAEYRASGCSRQGLFLYQFEAICRNRLSYDYGLAAVAADPMYDEDWREWILTVRRQVGIVDFADMIYVRSEHYRKVRGKAEKPILFGEKEGKIALANRRKDPLYLFSALSRHLGYPSVPRPKRGRSPEQLFPLLVRRVERLETRVKLLEEELRGGINLARFYKREETA
ncbi:MAG TPA: hypothetical protein EYP56_05275 [Planctomycetaceae bacterium]|nr:hypothetical protein [Planctomycetaceae bacterium]